jgi:hypothetical protein
MRRSRKARELLLLALGLLPGAAVDQRAERHHQLTVGDGDPIQRRPQRLIVRFRLDAFGLRRCLMAVDGQREPGQRRPGALVVARKLLRVPLDAGVPVPLLGDHEARFQRPLPPCRTPRVGSIPGSGGQQVVGLPDHLDQGGVGPPDHRRIVQRPPRSRPGRTVSTHAG